MADEPTLSRRSLFRGIGTATVLAGCKTSDAPQNPDPSKAGPQGAGQVGPDAAALSFELNGKPVSLQVEPRTTLLEALRTDLDTTGPKEVCDRGACGACIVHVDGRPRNACMMLALDVEGRAVTTVEGLAQGETLSTLQQAFVKHDAQQCGFCTSGMLMSASALITLNKQKGKQLQRVDVEHALSGNLCRCGTYPHVVSAVLDAASKGGA
jgi:aerobic-type carbon monoxide dehydrogenase small subunit (CoxS/CutS family)